MRSVSLRGKRRFSDVDVEKARLLHQYALDRASADAQRFADFQYARAALVEAQDTLYSSALRSSWTIVSSSHWLLKLTPRRHRIHSLPGSHSGGTFCCSRHWQWLRLDGG